jgi:predicted XRE-type DNA-binding protein
MKKNDFQQSKKELNKKQFAFPPEEELEKVRERISKSDKRTNMGLPPNATAAEKAKYNLCKRIARYERENKLSEPELAKKLGISHPQVEKILFCHIDKLNLEELINFVEGLAVPLEMKINSKYE